MSTAAPASEAAETLLGSLEKPQQDAVRLVRLLIDTYNGKDGTGLFTGPARYHVLEDRIRLAAVQSRTGFEFVSRTLRSMRWPSPPRKDDEAFIAHMSTADQSRVLAAIARDTAAIVLLARHAARDDVAGAA